MNKLQFSKTKKILPIIIAILFIIPVIPALSKLAETNRATAIKQAYANLDKNGLTIKLTAVDTTIGTLSADSENKYELKVKVTDSDGSAVPYADVRFFSNGPDVGGSFEPRSGTTGADGFLTTFYVPPAALDMKNRNKTDMGKSTEPVPEKNTPGAVTTELVAMLDGTDKSSSVKIKLIPVPVVLVHGYQASPDIFSGLREYLSEEGYQALAPDYDSEKGVAPAASQLSEYLDKRMSVLKANGIQTKRFDIIAHSMGGLVARYYTCSNEYSIKNDVRKLIFVSVPHKGSPFASLGLQYYSCDSIRDMATDSDLMASVFPSMRNSGLNPSIETGNILDRFDEVVSVQNASLAEWKINTEIFDVGESNLTVDKLMNGEILKATNHKRILYNMKVYHKIVEMLGRKLPYPTSLSK